MVTSVAKALLENTTHLWANQFPIKTVKLFQGSGSAEVTRTFPLSFLRAQDEPQVVEIAHLPACIQSVDVAVTSTSGNVAILDHYHSNSTTKAENATPSSPTLRELETERLRLEDEKRLRQQSFVFLSTYMDSLAQCKSQNQAEAAQMVAFFDEFVELGVTRSAVIAETDDKLTDIRDKIAEETERLSKLTSNLSLNVVTVLSCKSQLPVEAAELTVTYVVKHVSWKPSYDLRIAMAGNTPSPTATLDFRCTVTQWTGEDWENVSLALTTTDQASQSIQLPEPKRIDISLRERAVFSSNVNAHPFLQRTHFGQTAPIETDHANEVRVLPQSLFGSTSSMKFAQPPPPPPPPPPPGHVGGEFPKMEVPPQNVSQLTSHGTKDPITHIVDGCIFIPSDRAAHHVLVASLALHAEFQRVVVPSVDTRVYYTCEVKNTSNYVLLPGTVKTYLNDRHVSSTEIQNTDLPQILECSLAVDTGVKAMQTRAPEALPSLSAFSSKTTTTYTSTAVLQSTHAEPIRGVVVRTSIPLPADPRITIVLKEPAGLAEIDEGNVTVKEGCLARWSTTGGRKGKQVGLFEWVCDMNPGTDVFKAVWDVCAPGNMEVVEQERSSHI